MGIDEATTRLPVAAWATARATVGSVTPSAASSTSWTMASAACHEASQAPSTGSSWATRPSTNVVAVRSGSIPLPTTTCSSTGRSHAARAFDAGRPPIQTTASGR